MIEVDGLEKSFGARRVVKGISFQAHDRAITGVLGANGAGKTTLLRMIAGVLKPSGGSARVNGIPVTNQAGIQSQLGAILDHTGIYQRFTPRENLAYFGKLRGITGTALEKRVDATLELLGLQELADVPAIGFSQGERMKIALGRIILHEPSNLLLDEPTNALDITSIHSLRSLFKRMRDGGRCLIFCSHILEDVQALCDRVVIIARGHVVAEGTIAEICASTATPNLEEAFITATSKIGESR